MRSISRRTHFDNERSKVKYPFASKWSRRQVNSKQTLHLSLRPKMRCLFTPTDKGEIEMLWEDQTEEVKAAILGGVIGSWISLSRNRLAIGIPSPASDDIIIVYASGMDHSALAPEMTYDIRNSQFQTIGKIFKQYDKELSQELWDQYRGTHNVSTQALEESINKRIEYNLDDPYMIGMFITGGYTTDLDIPAEINENISHYDGYTSLTAEPGTTNSIYHYLAQPTSFVVKVAERIFAINKDDEPEHWNIETHIRDMLVNHYAMIRTLEQFELDPQMCENRKLYNALLRLQQQGAKNAYVVFDVDNEREYQLLIEDIMSRVRCNIGFASWRFKKTR